MQGSRRNPLDLRHPGRVFIATALVALAIDQIAKSVARANLSAHTSIRLIPGVLNLTYVQNAGAAFGLFPGRQPVFIVTSLLVLFVIAAFWRRARPTEWPVVIALALVTAGALGNLIDRAVFGHVADFFEFGFIDFPVFNIADMCILFGVLILMAWILFGPEVRSAEPVTDTDAAAYASAVESVDATPAVPPAGGDTTPAPATETDEAAGTPGDPAPPAPGASGPGPS